MLYRVFLNQLFPAKGIVNPIQKGKSSLYKISHTICNHIAAICKTKKKIAYILTVTPEYIFIPTQYIPDSLVCSKNLCCEIDSFALSLIR